MYIFRAVGAKGQIPPPYFVWSVNPISTGEPDYAHHINTAPFPRIFKPPTATVTYVRTSLVDCARLKSVAKKY